MPSNSFQSPGNWALFSKTTLYQISSFQLNPPVMGASASVKTPPDRKIIKLPPDDTFERLKSADPFEENAHENIEWIMSELKKFPTVRTPVLSVPLEYLVVPTCSENRKGVKKWTEKIQEYDIVQWVLWLWPTFWEPDFIKVVAGKQKHSAEQLQIAKIVWTNFNHLSMMFWNGTDSSVSFCMAVVNGGIIEELVKLLDRDDFEAKKMGTDYVRNYIVQAVTGVIHNCMRFCHIETKARFRSAEGVRILREYMDANDALIRTKAAMCLAFGINETEIDIINTKGDIIKYMVNTLLSPAVDNPDHRTDGFIAQEIIEALNALAVNDDNKVKMVTNGVLPLYKKVLDLPKDDPELLAAVEGFWILSFKEDIAKQIREIDGCVAGIEKVKSHKSLKLSKAATGALWNISGRTPSAKVNKTKKSKTGAPKAANEQTVPATGHVMISYDHQHKEVVREFNKRLKERGFNTWLDHDRMSGSTLEAMAEAIENASVVIVCMSDRYKHSPSCRTEAEYAYRLQKDIIPIRTEFRYKPDGWLGILMGTKLYFDCHSEELIDVCCDGVVKELGTRGQLCAVQIVEKQRTVATAGKGNESRAKFSADKTDKWDKERVQKWFRDNEMGHLGPKFGSFDGKLLSELKGMYKTSPTVFYQKAETQLGLTDLADMLKFTWNLDRLK